MNERRWVEKIITIEQIIPANGWSVLLVHEDDIKHPEAYGPAYKIERWRLVCWALVETVQVLYEGSREIKEEEPVRRIMGFAVGDGLVEAHSSAEHCSNFVSYIHDSEQETDFKEFIDETFAQMKQPKEGQH